MVALEDRTARQASDTRMMPRDVIEGLDGAGASASTEQRSHQRQRQLGAAADDARMIEPLVVALRWCLRADAIESHNALKSFYYIAIRRYDSQTDVTAAIRDAALALEQSGSPGDIRRASH